jgi:hypothetical protein
MSQRESGYDRRERDGYMTPSWVTAALIPRLPELSGFVWEPACGTGLMAKALESAGLAVVASDIADGDDFLGAGEATGCGTIITNSPYGLAQEFIEHALDLMEPVGLVAMLLRTDYEHGQDARSSFLRSSGLCEKTGADAADRLVRGQEGGPQLQSPIVFMVVENTPDPPTLAYDVPH